MKIKTAKKKKRLMGVSSHPKQDNDSNINQQMIFAEAKKPRYECKEIPETHCLRKESDIGGHTYLTAPGARYV